MPFHMVIGLNVSPIVTAVSRQRGVATQQRGGNADMQLALAVTHLLIYGDSKELVCCPFSPKQLFKEEKCDL